MPIYEYSCAKCGDFEVSQRIADKPLRRCPTCKAKVTKLISATAFQFKGSGWYVTDYARKGPSDGADSKEGGESAAASKDDSAKESSAKSGDSKKASSSKESKSSGKTKAADAA